MKKLLLILLCVPLIGLGQGWEKIYDLNGNRSMAKSNYESCLNLNNLSSAMIEAYDYMKRPYTAPK